jgi:hypothetical protein
MDTDQPSEPESPLGDSEPPDDLARELRERVGHEMRQEAEMLEQDAASVEMRRRHIADVAIEILSRGDIVTVIAGDRSIRGHLSYARGEIASVETAAGRVDIHLAAGVILRVDERSTEGGRTPRVGSDTLRARLLELELSGRGVELWVPAQGIEVTGPITAVGKDHVIVRDQDNAEWIVLLVDVAWIRTI